MKRIAFFNNKGGIGRTTLVYHLAHMMVDQGQRVLMVDLDPQSNLTTMCLSEERLEELWPDSVEHPSTVLGSVRPLLRGTGDINEPHVEELREGLGLVPGDFGLSTFEDELSDAWSRALDRDASAFQTLSAFHRLAGLAANKEGADVVLYDMGSDLGALNRVALLAADFILTPLAPDLFSMQGLRNLGPTLIGWRRSWKARLDQNPTPSLDLPSGEMRPLGYVVIQAGMRLSHPVRTYAKWVSRIPGEYHRSVLRDEACPSSMDEDPWCLGIMRHYYSLMALARDARKPIFHLKPAEGAIGVHMDTVERCRKDFDALSRNLLSRADALLAQG
jgi:chromosome partitioning protein